MRRFVHEIQEEPLRFKFHWVFCAGVVRAVIMIVPRRQHRGLRAQPAEERAFLEKFARFINNHNISELNEEFNEAFYHLERNASAKILFTDLVIRLTKLIKKGV